MNSNFRRPEDINIAVEYLNPSFLIKKANGGYRLVTAFADVGHYSKPQPSLMPDINSILRLITQWKHIVATDLTSTFYQIPLSRDSMKYCGVATLFRGVRVYTRSAMGMPGSETALEELMSRVLGDLLEEGIVAKIADDLYCGGNSPEELLQNWTKVLRALHKWDLHLSASKTISNPQSTTILGWIWNCSTLSASPHRIAALASCPAPDTVARMRSFIGALRCSPVSFLDALHSLQNSTTLSLAANLTNRSSEQMTSEHHSATPKPPCPLPTPSRSPDVAINCGLWQMELSENLE